MVSLQAGAEGRPGSGGSAEISVPTARPHPKVVDPITRKPGGAVAARAYDRFRAVESPRTTTSRVGRGEVPGEEPLVGAVCACASGLVMVRTAATGTVVDMRRTIATDRRGFMRAGRRRVPRERLLLPVG